MSEKIKICMVLSTPIPPEEGIGSYVFELSKRLIKEGHGVSIVTRSRKGTASTEMIEGIEVIRTRFFPLFPFHIHLHSILSKKTFEELSKRINIFHLHSPLPPFFSTKIPLVVTFHTTTSGNSKYLSWKKWRDILYLLQTPISIEVEKRLIRLASHIVCVAQNVQDEIQGYGVESNCSIIENFIDSDFFVPGLEPTQDYILSVGRLGVRKGWEDLVVSAKIVCKKHPNIKFFIVGDGPLHNSLHRKIVELGLEENVFLVGRISDKEKLLSFFQNALMFVHPAHYESGPRVVLEAMAAGCPVISTPVGIVPKLIENKINGIIVPSKQPKELAKSILMLYGDPALQNVIKDNGRKIIEAKWSSKNIAQEHLDLYFTIINNQD